MQSIKHVPFFFYILIIYNLIAFFAIDPQTGQNFLTLNLFEFRLISGSTVAIDGNSLVIIVALHALYFEILKATRSTVSSIINHTLSLGVFIVCLVEFIVVKPMGTAAFLIVTIMALFVVVAGFTVSISTARRDITFGR